MFFDMKDVFSQSEALALHEEYFGISQVQAPPVNNNVSPALQLGRVQPDPPVPEKATVVQINDHPDVIPWRYCQDGHAPLGTGELLHVNHGIFNFAHVIAPSAILILVIVPVAIFVVVILPSII